MPKLKTYKEDDLPIPGSVFMMPLPDGRFGVARVIRRKTEEGMPRALLVASPWIGNDCTRPHDALEFVACAARYPELAEEVDEWRDW